MKKNVQQALIKQQQEIERMAIAASEHLNDIHSIRSYLTRRVAQMELTPTQEHMLSLYEFAYNQLISGKYTDDEVAELVALKCGGNKSEAYAIIRESRDLYCSSIKFNRKWELKREKQVNQLLREKAEAMGDYKAAAAFSKIIAKLIEMSEEEDEREDTFTGHTLVVSASPEILGVKKPDKKEVKKLLDDLKKKYNYEPEEAIIIEDE